MPDFDVFVSYSQIAVFDAALLKPFNNWTPEHVAQGFAWRNGSVSFSTLSESEVYKVGIVSGIDIPISPAAIRVIEVPFLVPKSGIVEIASIGEGQQIELAPGQYRLRFEAFSQPAIRLVFCKDAKDSFAILRADPGLTLNKPLLKTAEPA